MSDREARSAAQRRTKVRDADRVLRCWKCKAERVLTAHEYAAKRDTRTPLASPFDPCECGGFFALHRLAHRERHTVTAAQGLLAASISPTALAGRREEVTEAWA